MRRIMGLTFVVIAVIALAWTTGALSSTSAQDTVSDTLEGHPLVGSWLVDTDITTETDAPQLGIWTSDGIMIGPGDGATAGTWQAADEHTGLVSFIGPFPDGSGSIVVRGPHTVDDAGETWTAPYSWTIVAPDGSVLDSGESTARGIRIQEDPNLAASAPYGAGTALANMPTWAPASPEATPAT
jgi:hypothetical protein